MNLEVGDKVKVIDEAQEGIVISILKNTQVVVEIDDFEFTFRVEQLVKVDDSEINIYKSYELHSPPKVPEELKNALTPTLSKREKVEELGRVRGKRNSRGILEFDLHIHDLLVTHKGMHPGEMLDYQKEYAINCIEEALKKRESSIVFIHGIGKGVLKSELLKIIRDYQFEYEDASMREYGVGATEVLLR